MKAIAQATGQFELLDFATRDFVGPDRPRVVKWSTFFEARTGAGQIKVLASGLPDTATDAEFIEYLKEAPELAVDAYVSTFAEEKPVEAKPAPKRSAKKEA